MTYDLSENIFTEKMHSRELRTSPFMRGTVYTGRFNGWDTVRKLLDRAGLASMLPQELPILIKPNLVEVHLPPITTPVALVDALVAYLKTSAPGVRIIIGEGCGSLEYDTMHVFDVLGYTAMAEKYQVELLDLNSAATRYMSIDTCSRWPEMHLPGIALDSFLISVPVLKAHSLAGVTLTMKNMMGLAPPAHYQQGGHWKKAAFHTRIQEAVHDLNCYRTPDFTLLDATIGMQEAHLWGPTCKPPPNRLAAGNDPVAIDAYGCQLLKKDWRKIGHLRMAHNKLGLAEPLEIIEV